jgi:hypothetical protein
MSCRAESIEQEQLSTDFLTSLQLDSLWNTVSQAKNRISGQHNDLISFLAAVQKFRIDLLPITWQPEEVR